MLEAMVVSFIGTILHGMLLYIYLRHFLLKHSISWIRVRVASSSERLLVNLGVG